MERRGTCCIAASGGHLTAKESTRLLYCAGIGYDNACVTERGCRRNVTTPWGAPGNGLCSACRFKPSPVGFNSSSGGVACGGGFRHPDDEGCREYKARAEH